VSKHITLALVVLLLLSACAPAAVSTTKPEDSTLRIGTLPILDLLPLFVADKQGYFKEQGITVAFVPAQSAAERDQLMQAGQIDGMNNDMVSVALYNKDVVKIKVVRTAIQATPAWSEFSIFAAPGSGIKSAADLKGVEIGVSQATVIEYVTARLLMDAGLAASDIKTTNVIKIADRMQLLGSGQLKAATLPEPLATLAEQQGALRIVPDAKNPQYSNSVISFSAQAIKDKPNTIRKFLVAYEKAVNDVNADPTRWQPLLNENKIIPPALTDYKLPAFPKASVPSQEQFADALKWMKDKGMVSVDVPYANLVDASFLPK
jgi:NitT/TauT family transport system substrate-binding protein